MYALIINHKNGLVEYELYEYRYLKRIDAVKRMQILKITKLANNEFLYRENRIWTSGVRWMIINRLNYQNF